MNIPTSWPHMSWYQKRCYLVNTHQAKDFKHAGQILRPVKTKQTKSPIPVIRLPYADN